MSVVFATSRPILRHVLPYPAGARRGFEFVTSLHPGERMRVGGLSISIRGSQSMGRRVLSLPRQAGASGLSARLVPEAVRSRFGNNPGPLAPVRAVGDIALTSFSHRRSRRARGRACMPWRRGRAAARPRSLGTQVFLRKLSRGICAISGRHTLSKAARKSTRASAARCAPLPTCDRECRCQERTWANSRSFRESIS